MNQKLLESEVISIENLNYKFRLIQLQFKERQEKFIFQPGQFVVIKVGPAIYRSYSVASILEDLPDWKIFVDITPGGPGSMFIKNLKPGHVIQHSSGKGVFVLNQKPALYSVMAATGCGVASLIPMIEKLLQQTDNKVILIWGLRYQRDICLIRWLTSVDNPNFSYQIVLSKPSRMWKGAKGYVTTQLIDLVSKIPLKSQEIYLCGNKLMINDVKLLLQKVNFAQDKIYFERYY